MSDYADQQEQQAVLPAVSALIVSHNSAPALRRCLAALEASKDRERLEVVVVDNGSLDESPRLDTEFPNTVFLRLPRNFGLTKALNIGIRTAHAELMFLLSPDIEVRPETVSLLAGKLDADPTAAAVAPLIVSEDGQPVTELRPLPTPAAFGEVFRGGSLGPPLALPLDRDEVEVEFPSTSAIMVRRVFLKGMNYFDERYGQFWADAELCFQFQWASKRLLLLPGVRATRHGEAAPLTAATPGGRALLAVDCANGAAEYVSKHYGLLASLKFRFSAALYSLGRTIGAMARFRDVPYELGRFTGLLSGRKVDGSQSEL